MNWFKEIWDKITRTGYVSELENNIALNTELLELAQRELYDIKEEYLQLEEDFYELQRMYKRLENRIFYHPKEKELNNKYPTKNITYTRRETDGSYSVDVRTFFNEFDHKVPIVLGRDDNTLAFNALQYVKNNIKYITDKQQYGFPEYWAYAYQTLGRRKGDCEDGAILLANIMLASGIPYWKIRVTAGDTPVGGHAYVVYYYEKENRWVSLDWCYYPNNKKIKDRVDYKKEPLYGNVWFSFNSQYAFAKGTKALTGVKIGK